MLLFSVKSDIIKETQEKNTSRFIPACIKYGLSCSMCCVFLRQKLST